MSIDGHADCDRCPAKKILRRLQPIRPAGVPVEGQLELVSIQLPNCQARGRDGKPAQKLGDEDVGVYSGVQDLGAQGHCSSERSGKIRGAVLSGRESIASTGAGSRSLPGPEKPALRIVL